MVEVKQFKSKFEVSVKINGGIFGNFDFTGAYEEVSEYCGDDYFTPNTPIVSLIGNSTPVYCNGEYFLPWHVTAALTDNGDGGWVTTHSEAEIVYQLLKMRQLYLSGNWYNCVKYANSLTNNCVY